MSSQSLARRARRSTTSRTFISVSGSARARATSTHSNCFRLAVLPALPRHPRRRPHLFRSPRPRRLSLRALPLRRLRPLPLHLPPSPLPHSHRPPPRHPLRLPHRAHRLAGCRLARRSSWRGRPNTASRARCPKLAIHLRIETLRASPAEPTRRRRADESAVAVEAEHRSMRNVAPSARDGATWTRPIDDPRRVGARRRS